jgi:hypothetical protein
MLRVVFWADDAIMKRIATYLLLHVCGQLPL